MSDDVAIRVKNLGKRYKLGQQTGGYKTLGETITKAVKSPFQRLHHLGSEEEKEEAGTFWALRDVSFEVKKGEVIGIIGRNGAGKSTLLKILSRITAPTEGTVEINGRVGSLLEVGTGFHPELTGRENIFLSGSIMGMKKVEIEDKFDQIVKFAEIEKFLDTPVKRYSSGMYVRLAFAVAAHLEPEILIVDEVLAVGDAAFQKKCLGKMGDIANEGRTVIFVSHAMDSVRKLCSKCALLTSGSLTVIGETDSIIGMYINQGIERINTTSWVRQSHDSWIKNEFTPTKFLIENFEGDVISSTIGKSKPVWIRIEGIIKNLWSNLIVGIAVYKGDGTLLFENFVIDSIGELIPNFKEGNNNIRVKLPLDLFNAGTYRIELICALHQMHWIIPPGTGPVLSFDLINDNSESLYTGFDRRGLLTLNLEWEFN